MVRTVFPRLARGVIVAAAILALLSLLSHVETSRAAGPDVATSTTAWRTFLYNPAHRGYNPFESTINPSTASSLSLKWSVAVSSTVPGISVQPIVAGNRIYWGANDGYLRASTLKGGLVWKTSLGQTHVAGCPPEYGGVASTATFANLTVGSATSVLFVGGGNARLYALNAANGQILWSTALGVSPDYFIWSSPALYNGSIYIGVSSFMDCPVVRGRLFKLNATTGQIQARFNVVPAGCTGGGIWSAPTIDAAAGTVYISTGNPGTCGVPEPYAAALVELRLTDLSPVGFWSVPSSQQTSDSDFGATPTLFKAIIGGQAVPLVGALNKNGWYYALRRDALKQGPVWSAQFGRTNCRQCSYKNVAPSAFDGKTLYIGTGDTIPVSTYCAGSAQAVDPASGALKWQLCLPNGPVMGGVIGVPGLVAFTSADRIIVASAADGQVLLNYNGLAQFSGPVTIVNGWLYAGDQAGNLYALAP